MSIPLSSGLKPNQPYIPVLAPGVETQLRSDQHFSTNAEMILACNAERTNIGMGLGIWKKHTKITIAEEPGVDRYWVIDGGGSANRAEVAPGLFHPLASEANTVTFQATPTGGNNGDVAIDRLGNRYLVKTSGTWVKAGDLIGGTAGVASNDAKIVTTSLYTVLPTDKRLQFPQACDVTFPADLGANFECGLMRTGTGLVRFLQGSGATLSSDSGVTQLVRINTGGAVSATGASSYALFLGASATPSLIVQANGVTYNGVTTLNLAGGSVTFSNGVMTWTPTSTVGETPSPSTEIHPWALGTYIGNPNGNDENAMNYYKDMTNAVVNIFGKKMQRQNAFLNFGASLDQWVGDASWNSWSWQKTGDGFCGPNSGVIPVQGVPMALNAGDWGGAVVGFYDRIISGELDYIWQGLVDIWAQWGYKTIHYRPGYEFNGNFMPWAPGNAGDKAVARDKFKLAFRRIYTVIHARAVEKSVTAKVFWNPACISDSTINVMSLYPGDDACDGHGIDVYSPLWPLDLTDWATDGVTSMGGPNNWWEKRVWGLKDANRIHFYNYQDAKVGFPNGSGQGWSMTTALQFARDHAKPVSICETGAGAKDTSLGPRDEPLFGAWLGQKLTDAIAAGSVIEDVLVWATDQADGAWTIMYNINPQSARSWAKGLGTGTGTNGMKRPKPGSVRQAAGTPTMSGTTIIIPIPEGHFPGMPADLITVKVDGQVVPSKTGKHMVYQGAEGSTLSYTGYRWVRYGPVSDPDMLDSIFWPVPGGAPIAKGTWGGVDPASGTVKIGEAMLGLKVTLDSVPANGATVTVTLNQPDWVWLADIDGAGFPLFTNRVVTRS